ncbi:MAG: hypothetical protein QOF40_1906 [Actinomycetota bacterium]|jgi:hypothetical protein|nr:hypothetical protein [Actinomycetota bacterium]
MRRVRRVVERSNGRLRYIPIRELWEVSGVLADTFPLDRSLARAPRNLRRIAHWTRLILVDRAVTNDSGTALLTMSDTPWVPAAVAAVVAAVVAPRLPAWSRRLLFGATVVWAVRDQRLRRFLEMRRELGRLAPDALLVGDFVARAPGVGMGWVGDVLDTIGALTAFVALVPASGDARRDAARVRLYTTRLGFRVAGQARTSGQQVTILVRDGNVGSVVGTNSS